MLEEDIVRLEVAVNHGSRVRERERLGDLAQQPCRLVDGKRAVERETVPKRLASDVWGDVVEQTISRASGEHGQDVRMLELRSDEHFALEAVCAGLAREFWWQKLDHHFSVQRSLGREKEPAHPTGRELTLDLVGFAERGLKSILKRSRHTKSGDEELLIY